MRLGTLGAEMTLESLEEDWRGLHISGSIASMVRGVRAQLSEEFDGRTLSRVLSIRISDSSEEEVVKYKWYQRLRISSAKGERGEKLGAVCCVGMIIIGISNQRLDTRRCQTTMRCNPPSVFLAQ
jgi:hypothetical protein